MDSAGGIIDEARRGSTASDVLMHDGGSETASVNMDPSSSGMGSTRRQVHPSAYMAPEHVRLQSEREHSRGEYENERLRGNLTADNLAGIPEADQVAPGIRLETAGAAYRLRQQQSQSNEEQGQALDDRQNSSNDAMEQAVEDRHMNEGRPEMHIDGPSSTGMSGRSSTGAIDNDDVGQNADDGDDVFQEAHEDALVHERVGGSGATSENASKGTSVGHFGPLGEAIPGVPPHLDPRQPHFRPPSPSAASVFSVTVQPPASPKVLASAGTADADTVEGEDAPSLDSGVVDSGDETESFDNGVATPTRSEDDEVERRDMMTDYADDGQSKLGASGFGHGHDREATPASNTPYEFQRLQLDSEGQHTPGSVSFNPVVTSHRGSVSSFYSTRAPSIAATAGSSRAPSTRGLSPPPTASRTGTSSSIEEFDSTGTGLMGDTGNETPSVGRSRRSSYSAPSSEAADGGVGAAPMHGAGEEAGHRGRGATLVASNPGSRGNLSTFTNASDAPHDDDDTRSQPTDGPSLAPSEAGSDSTRSVANDSSLGHGTWVGGFNAGGGSSSSDRYNNLHHWTQQSPIINEPSPIDGVSGMAGFAGSSSGGGLKSPLSMVPPPPNAAHQAALPNLLAIKRAARRQSGSGSAAASTAGATTGTASPKSSLSVDGDFNESMEESAAGETV